MSSIVPSVRGSVSLVALCFIAVLGIALAGYLTLSSRAMQLSNRSFQSTTSQQLAEFGIEEGLRAFNNNDWSGWSSNPTNVSGATSAWSLDTTNKRASRSISLGLGKLGQSLTATVKIRIDNYDAKTLGSPWNSTATYGIGNIIGYGGNWYTSLRSGNSGNTPSVTGSFTWWAPAPIPSLWSQHITYNQFDLTNRNGIWYRYINSTSTAGNSPPQPVALSSYWVTIPSMREWATGVAYSQNDVVCNTDSSSGNIGIYRCISDHTSSSSFSDDSARWSSNVQTISFSWSSSTVYSRGSIVRFSNVWYYCRQAGSSMLTPNADTDRWAPFLSSAGAATTPTDVAPTSGVRYVVGDYIYYSGAWRRCTVEHTYSTYNSGNWTTTNPVPHVGWAWRYNPSKSYVFNDVVYYAGTWYRCILGYNSNASTYYPTNSSMASYWENALSDSWDWSSSTSYHLGDVVYTGGSFYRCTKAHSSQSPPNATYWSTEPSLSSYWDPSRTYNRFDVVRYRGSWFLCLQDGSSGMRPGTDAIYWAIAPRAIRAWSASDAYHIDDLVSSGSNWYRCIKDHLNQSVNSTTYWVQVAGANYVWDSAIAYTAGATYRSYGGIWYKCITSTTANDAHSPNDATYWTPTWLQSSGATTGAPVITAECTINLSGNPPSRTQIRTALDPAPAFPNAAAAGTALTVSGGTGVVDSYDSDLAAYNSSNAGYSAVLAAGTNSPSGTSTLLTIGTNTTVMGYLAAPPSTSPPYAPRTIYDTSAIVHSATSDPSGNVDRSQLSRSPYIPNFDIIPAVRHTSLPTTIPSALNLGTPGSPTPSIYYDTSPSIGSTVNINGPVIWYVSGNFRVNTGDTVNINSTGSLTIYITNNTTGRLRIESGSGGIVNKTQKPKNLVILADTPSTGTQYYSYVNASAPLYGILYIPYTTCSTGLTLASGLEVYGAISASLLNFSGAANLHYDTSLRYESFCGVDQPFAVSDWRELSQHEQASMP